MSDSFDFTDARAVVPGAVGEPGRRTFFVQVHASTGILSFKVEKQQVAALCEYFESVLGDLPGSDPLEPPTPPDVLEPTSMIWTVGGLGVAWEPDDDRLLIVAEELLTDDEVDDDAREPATARFHLTPAQVKVFMHLGNELVQAGRPGCRLCGRPIDADGHTCPRLN